MATRSKRVVLQLPAAAKDLEALLRDPVWRLHNLYWIKTKQAKAVKFRPNAAQAKIIEAIHVKKLRKILIPKARQLGMSTVIDLIALDLILFNAGTQAAIVDQTQKDATKKLKGKILFAFHRLPAAIRNRFQVLKANDHTLSIRLRGAPEDAESQVQAGMNARGDTFQMLHISEWGPIAFKDPPRSDEIMTGALPAAECGLVIVETTWKGGKVGHLWELTKEALEISDAHRTESDFTVFFFPWWGDEGYMLKGDGRQISAECRKYLDDVEKEIRAGSGLEKGIPGFKFTAGQRLWYYKEAWKKGLFRFQEYPSVLSECFRAPIEGAIYAELLDKLRAGGRIAEFPIDPSVPVCTFWDLGAPANMVTWYCQMIGPAGSEELRFIDCDCGLDLIPGERVQWMREKAAAGGFRYGFHFLPHDAAASEEGGRTVQAELEAVGLENTRVIPRTADVWIGINRVRQMFSRMRFRAAPCEKGLNSLEAYRSGVWIERGRQMDVPVHDKASHAADGLRTLGEADLAGMLEAGWIASAFDEKGLAALRGGK